MSNQGCVLITPLEQFIVSVASSINEDTVDSFHQALFSCPFADVLPVPCVRITIIWLHNIVLECWIVVKSVSHNDLGLGYGAIACLFCTYLALMTMIVIST